MILTSQLFNQMPTQGLQIEFPHPAEKMPLASIVICNYNYGQFIGEAIDSSLSQTYPNIEIIVVDDGSTDNSRQVIAAYGDRIKPVLKENGGQPSAYNAGFAASKGDIICFLDSDDLFMPEKVEQVVNTFNSADAMGWCFHSLKLIDVNQTILPISTTENYKNCECDFRNRLRAGKIPPSIPPCSGLSFRRSLLEKILPMPAPSSIKATDHYVKFMAVALSKGFMLSDALALQRIHSNNAATLRTDKQHLKAREFIYTALWIKTNFPEFRKFADKWLALGISTNRGHTGQDPENSKAIKEFFSSSSFLDVMRVQLISLYYALKQFLGQRKTLNEK